MVYKAQLRCAKEAEERRRHLFEGGEVAGGGVHGEALEVQHQHGGAAADAQRLGGGPLAAAVLTHVGVFCAQLLHLRELVQAILHQHA